MLRFFILVYAFGRSALSNIITINQRRPYPLRGSGWQVNAWHFDLRSRGAEQYILTPELARVLCDIKTDVQVFPGLSLTEAYSIKVKGQVELGNKLYELLKDLGTEISKREIEGGKVDFGSSFSINPSSKPSHDSENQKIDGEAKRKDKIKTPKDTDGKELAIMDKMVKSDQKELHLYGNHKVQDRKPGEPLNNVHF